MPAALGAHIGTIAQLSSRHNARIRTVHFACLGRSDFPEHVVSGGISGLIWETSGGGFDGGVEYIVVLRHHNKEPCMNPATQ